MYLATVMANCNISSQFEVGVVSIIASLQITMCTVPYQGGGGGGVAHG